MVDILPTPALQFFGGLAGVVVPAPVVPENVAILPCHPGEVRYRIGKQAEALLAGLEGFRGTLNFRHVPQETGKTRRFTRISSDGELTIEALATVPNGLQLQAAVQDACLAAGEIAPHPCAVRLAILRRDDRIAQVAAEHVGLLKTKGAFGGGIELGDTAIYVHADDAVQGRFHDRAVPGLALFEGITGKFSLRDIAVVNRGFSVRAGRDIQLEPPVPGFVVILETDRCPLRGAAQELAMKAGSDGSRIHFPVVSADEFLPALTVDPLGGGVHVKDRPVAIH